MCQDPPISEYPHNIRQTQGDLRATSGSQSTDSLRVPAERTKKTKRKINMTRRQQGEPNWIQDSMLLNFKTTSHDDETHAFR